MAQNHSAEEVNPYKVRTFLKLHRLADMELEQTGEVSHLTAKLLSLLAETLNETELNAVALEAALRKTNQLN